MWSIRGSYGLVHGIAIFGIAAVSIAMNTRLCDAQVNAQVNAPVNARVNAPVNARVNAPVNAQVNAPVSGSTPTVDQVIARNVEARGGMDRVKGVQTALWTGHISFSPGDDHPLSVEMARPGRIRSEVTIQGQSVVQAYDGHTAWTINPLQGPSGPQEMPVEAAKNVAAGGDMDGPLLDYAAKGNRVTLVGMDTADGRRAYKIGVKTASGLSDTYYIDAQSYLQTRWEGNRIVNGGPVVFESYFRDYRLVDGVMWAHRIDSTTEGKPGAQQIIMDTIQLNTPIPDSRFLMPSAINSAPAR